MREGGAEEGAVNVVAARHVVVVELTAPRAEELHRVVARERDAIAEPDREDGLLLAQGPRARPKLAALELGFLRGRGGGGGGWGWGRGRCARCALPCAVWREASCRREAHHVAQALGREDVARVYQPVEDARSLEHLVDALRRVCELFLCGGARETRAEWGMRTRWVRAGWGDARGKGARGWAGRPRGRAGRAAGRAQQAPRPDSRPGAGQRRPKGQALPPQAGSRRALPACLAPRLSAVHRARRAHLWERSRESSSWPRRRAARRPPSAHTG